MQIHSNLASGQLSTSQLSSSQAAQAFEAAPLAVAISPEKEAQTAGNTRFPPISKPDANEKSNSQDLQKGTREDSKNSNNDDRSEISKERLEKQKLEQERREISELAARDREVRAHEQAHMAVGGQYAGAASYSYKRGPDGVSYATGGEVPISTSKEANPQATIQKAQIIRRAALAPAEPSSQDRRVAAQAGVLEAEARKELALEARQKEIEKSEAEATKEVDESSSSENSEGKENPLNPKEEKPAINYSESNNKISSLPTNAPGSTGGKLIQSIANTTLSSSPPGSILDQIA